MKKLKNLCVTTLMLFCSSIFAVEVNREEITSVSQDAVVFENYSGPHSVINTAEEISSIGSGLGSQIAENIEESGRAGSAARYQIIHAVDPSEKGKLDADIFIIGENSSIDHIRNVRRVIAAYLVRTYGYSQSDADTIATFVTVYNAVYRGQTDVFQKKYKKVVTDNLTADKAGIALSYRDWPGKTQIVIPLNDVNGGLSSVDTSVISDKQVVQSMQNEDDKGVDSRKEMVAIKEREADSAQEKANESQKKAVEETNKLKEEKEKEAEIKKEAEEAKQVAEEAQQKAEENPDDRQAQKEAEEAQQKAEEKQAEAEEQQKAVEEQAQKAEEAKEEAASSQAVADTKRTEAQTERTEIAKDQQEIVRETAANESAESVYGLKAVDELGVLSELVRMNADTGKVIKESPVTVIRSRTVYEAGDNYVAIAGTNIGNGTVKLVLLDKEHMEIVKESVETVAENSVLVENGGEYYCIVQQGSSWAVGKFNSTVDNLLISPVSVKPASPITITSKGILVTSSSNRPVLLRLNDMTLIEDKSELENAK